MIDIYSVPRFRTIIDPNDRTVRLDVVSLPTAHIWRRLAA